MTATSLDQSRLCVRCSSSLLTDAQFCHRCGAQAQPAASQEGQRRLLTVLFCDLENSTGLSAKLDPEDLHDLYTSYGRVCEIAISHFKGHVAQYLGDGVLCYFGYPTAHEDDPVLAVRAALKIIEDLRLVNQGIGRRLNAELHVRVGIHTGKVRVGGHAGSSYDGLAVGQTVNMAARTQALAEVDTVLLTGETARQVEGYFELQKERPQIFRGLTKSMDLFRVLQPTGARTKLEAAARVKLTPYVGRQQELSELLVAWREVRDGADGVVAIRGEPGIGKSRILERFKRSVLEEHGQVVELFCSDLGQAAALGPVIEFLNARIAERLLEHAEPERAPAELRLEALSELLGEHSRFGADALALMADLLSIPGADEEPIAQLSPPRRRLRTLEILRLWLVSSAERVPLVLLVEDAHWADPTTLDLLDLIVRDGPGQRTLLCVSARPEFREKWQHARYRTLELQRLEAAEIETLVTNVAESRALPPGVLKEIREQSEGVPLYIEEMTKAVLESGALRLNRDAYELVGSFSQRELPSKLQGALLARFDRLGESQGIALLGAAIGREFDYQLLRAIADLTDERLQAGLARLSASELVYVRGEPPNSIYTFKHAKIQEAIYEIRLNKVQASAHERILEALREKFPERLADRPEIEAYHENQACRPDKAIPLLLRAGLNALKRTSVAEAVKHLARGVELIRDLKDEPTWSDTEIEFHAVLGPAYMATVGWANDLVEKSSERLRELATTKSDWPRLYQAIWSLWTVWFLRGNLVLGLAMAEKANEMATAANNPLLRVTGHHALGYTHFYRAEYTQAIEHARAGLEPFDEGTGSPEDKLERRQQALAQERALVATFQLSSSCALLCYLAQTQQVLGLADEAEATFARWRQLDDELQHPPSRAYSLIQQCHFCFARGDANLVSELAAKAHALCLAEGFGLWLPIADQFRAWASVRRGGDPLLALQAFERAKELVDGSGTHITELDFSSMQADILLAAGRPSEVFEVAKRALDLTRRGEVRHLEPELLRLQGDAALALGEREQAEQLYRSALENARSTGASLLAARAASALGRMTNNS